MSAAEQYPNLAAVAYHRGGVRLSAELRVEAADALERLNRTCAGCRHWRGANGNTIADHSGCHRFRAWTAPDFACNAWQPLTPAHDKEKS